MKRTDKRRQKKFSMTQEEAQLVVDAIVGWEECIGTAKEPSCPLCLEYLRPTKGRPLRYCHACPVYRYTGRHNCKGTPYYGPLPSRKMKPEYVVRFGLKMLDDAGYEMVEKKQK